MRLGVKRSVSRLEPHGGDTVVCTLLHVVSLGGDRHRQHLLQFVLSFTRRHRRRILLDLGFDTNFKII